MWSAFDIIFSYFITMGLLFLSSERYSEKTLIFCTLLLQRTLVQQFSQVKIFYACGRCVRWNIWWNIENWVHFFDMLLHFVEVLLKTAKKVLAYLRLKWFWRITKRVPGQWGEPWTFNFWKMIVVLIKMYT